MTLINFTKEELQKIEYYLLGETDPIVVSILEKIEALNALSRKDNETYVYSPCGVDEAVWDFMKCEHPEWPLPKHYVKYSFEEMLKQ